MIDKVLKILEEDGALLRIYLPFTFNDVVEKIKALPNVNAVPVRHGKWINDKGLYKCSVCNEFSIAGWANCIPIEQMNKTMKYCPNCGARMDAKDDKSHPFADSVMMGD